MNIAIIIAGGTGKRMGSEIPKQYIKIKNKPILAYTIESFEKHQLVDKILIVCKNEWRNEILSMKKNYGFNKVEWIVESGASAQDSIRNGVYF